MIQKCKMQWRQVVLAQSSHRIRYTAMSQASSSPTSTQTHHSYIPSYHKHPLYPHQITFTQSHESEPIRRKYDVLRYSKERTPRMRPVSLKVDESDAKESPSHLRFTRHIGTSMEFEIGIQCDTQRHVHEEVQVVQCDSRGIQVEKTYRSVRMNTGARGNDTDASSEEEQEPRRDSSRRRDRVRIRPRSRHEEEYLDVPRHTTSSRRPKRSSPTRHSTEHHSSKRRDSKMQRHDQISHIPSPSLVYHQFTKQTQTTNHLFKDLLFHFDFRAVQNVSQGSDEKVAPFEWTRRVTSPHKTIMTHIQLAKRISFLQKNRSKSFLISPHKSSLSPMEKEVLELAVQAHFGALDQKRATMEEFLQVTIQICHLPFFCNSILFGMLRRHNHVYLDDFVRFYKENILGHSDHLKYFQMLRDRKTSWITWSDMERFVSHIVESHPDFHQLRLKAREDNPPLSDRILDLYKNHVLIRMFHDMNNNRDGRITSTELYQSKFCTAMDRIAHPACNVDDEDHYFCMRHFIVLYCAYDDLSRQIDQPEEDAVLSKDYLTHSLQMHQALSRKALYAYDANGITQRMMDRVYDVCLRFMRGVQYSTQRTSERQSFGFTQFVYLILCDRLKSHSVSLQYWFDLLDVEEKGFVTTKVLRYFLNEQVERMHAIGLEEVTVNGLTQLIFRELEQESVPVPDAATSQQEQQLSLFQVLHGNPHKVAEMLDMIFNVNRYLVGERSSSDGHGRKSFLDIDFELYSSTL